MPKNDTKKDCAREGCSVLTTRKFCSPECYNLHRQPEPKPCEAGEHCLGDGLATGKRFCSRECYRANISRIQRAENDRRREPPPKTLRNRRYFDRHPNRVRAQRAAGFRKQELVAAGKFPTTCQTCGCAGDLEQHHTDYQKPDLIWYLCHSCHKRADLERKCFEEVVKVVREWVRRPFPVEVPAPMGIGEEVPA